MHILLEPHCKSTLLATSRGYNLWSIHLIRCNRPVHSYLNDHNGRHQYTNNLRNIWLSAENCKTMVQCKYHQIYYPLRRKLLCQSATTRQNLQKIRHYPIMPALAATPPGRDEQESSAIHTQFSPRQSTQNQRTVQNDAIIQQAIQSRSSPIFLNTHNCRRANMRNNAEETARLIEK